mmetsp:Transcript_41312/g.101953  ORF Transcript_41312/g.101953 Transcript_41312/m.101953 type:complete len:80 (-) Transcript_41312:70-309(-)
MVASLRPKQRVDRENMVALLRPLPSASEVGTTRSSSSRLTTATSVTRTKIENLELMLLEERLKRKDLERKVEAFISGSI